MSPFFNETNKFYGNYKSFSFYVGTKHHSKVLGSNLVLDGLVRKKKSICNVKLLLNWKSKINKQFIKKHAIQCAVVIHCVKIVNQFFSALDHGNHCNGFIQRILLLSWLKAWNALNITVGKWLFEKKNGSFSGTKEVMPVLQCQLSLTPNKMCCLLSRVNT